MPALSRIRKGMTSKFFKRDILLNQVNTVFSDGVLYRKTCCGEARRFSDGLTEQVKALFLAEKAPFSGRGCGDYFKLAWLILPVSENLISFTRLNSCACPLTNTGVIFCASSHWTALLSMLSEPLLRTTRTLLMSPSVPMVRRIATLPVIGACASEAFW